MANNTDPPAGMDPWQSNHSKDPSVKPPKQQADPDQQKDPSE